MEPVISPLSQPLNSFPHFMPNQVLTHTQLNELAVYLEQQDRFTRQRLLGIGIVCGLKTNLVVSGTTHTVFISRGVGLTSCGFLIDLPTELSFTQKKTYTTPTDYLPFLVNTGNTAPIICLELKDAASTETGVSSLTLSDVTDKIVVLFLDLQDKPNGKCIGANCDEKGNKWVFTLRVLLIDIADINKVLKKAYSPNVFINPLNSDTERQDYFNPEYQLPTVFVERFGNLNNNPNSNFTLPTINNYVDFESTYRSIILKSATRIANALADSYTLFKPLFDQQLEINSSPFGGFENPQASNTLVDKLADLLDPNLPAYRKGNCQYVYDFIRDMVDSYHELRTELFILASECSPNPGLFPRHLLLGELKQNVVFGKFEPDDYAPPSVYRNHFIYSPILNEQSEHSKKAKMLIQRIQLMLDSLDFENIITGSDKEPIIITPDKSCCSPLGNQRIPFYYHPLGTVQLSTYWNFSYTIQNRAIENRSYWAAQFVPGTLPAETKAILINPVLTDICSFPKLSIEGHVGKTLEQAVDELKRLRKKYNLSFDIIALKLHHTLNEVAIAEDNLIADIQTLYLKERNDFVCCLEDLLEYTRKNEKMIGTLLLLILIIISDDFPIIITSGVDWQSLINTLIDAYQVSILKMIESLPPNIKEFNFPLLYSIFPAFNTFTTLFKYGINTWGDIESFILNDKKGSGFGGQDFNWRLSDLISVLLNIWEIFLDKVDDDCILGKFYTLFAGFYSRVQTFTLFDKFNSAIHGMEHIAGTMQGGSFILVYEEVGDIIYHNGQVLDENGKPVEGAIVVNVADKNIVYGMTDNKGKFEVEIPDKETMVAILKPGHTMIEVKLGSSKKASQFRLPTYCAQAAGKKMKAGTKLSDVDTVYVNLKSAFDELKATDKTFGKMDTFIKFDATPKAVLPFKIGYNRNFRVVADFYLPHLIHNYKTEMDPLDACRELEETKMVDFNMISKLLNKEVMVGKASFKSTYSFFKSGTGK